MPASGTQTYFDQCVWSPKKNKKNQKFDEKNKNYWIKIYSALFMNDNFLRTDLYNV